MWTYRCYDDGGTPHLWQRWWDSNPAFHGAHDAVFRMLEQRTDWREPHAKYFDKKERIIEIRLTGNPKHRILGFYGGKQKEFIVLATCTHKQKVYDPPGIRKTVVKRQKEIVATPSKAKSCVRPSKPIEQTRT